MNQMNDFWVLRFIDRFREKFKNAGANYPVMRKLLQIMLAMDIRKYNPAVDGQDVNHQDTYNSMFKGYFFTYGVLGVFIVVIMLVPYSLFYKMSIILGLVIMLTMLASISDFSSVMANCGDRAILAPMPIDFVTVDLAKLLHKLIYMFAATFIIAAPSLLVGTIKYGILFAAVFFIEIIFIDMFVVFISSILYYFIFQFFNGNNLKAAIKYFGILLSVIMIIIFAFAGNSLEMLDLNPSFVSSWWVYLIPSAWFAAPYSILIDRSVRIAYIVLAIIAVLAPAIFFMAYYFLLKPYFKENSFLKFSLVNKKRERFIEGKAAFKMKASRIISLQQEENIFFRFTKKMLSGERQLKSRLYPGLVYAVAFPIIFLLASFLKSQSFFSVYWGLSNSPFYLSIYITLALLSNSYVLIYFSEKYKAAWLYRVLPLKDPSPIFKGSIKGFIVRNLLPVYLFIGFIFYLFYGSALVPHLIAMFINLIILVIINFDMRQKRLPFSLKSLEPQANSGYHVIAVTFVYCGASALIEYFASRLVFYGMFIYILAVLSAMILLWRVSFKQSWSDLK